MSVGATKEHNKKLNLTQEALWNVYTIGQRSHLNDVAFRKLNGMFSFVNGDVGTFCDFRIKFEGTSHQRMKRKHLMSCFFFYFDKKTWMSREQSITKNLKIDLCMKNLEPHYIPRSVTIIAFIISTTRSWTAFIVPFQSKGDFAFWIRFSSPVWNSRERNAARFMYFLIQLFFSLIPGSHTF